MKSISTVLAGVFGVCLIVLFFYSQSQISDRDSKIISLQQQNNQLIDEANTKLQEASQQYNNLVGEANEKLKRASQPEVSVTVGFRNAMMSKGSVAQIKNTSNRSIAVTIKAARPNIGKSQDFDVVIDAGAIEELGEQEGWAFVSGDTVTIEQAGHKTLSYTMN